MGEEVSDHFQKLIDDIEISPAQYERSPLITTQTEEFHVEIPRTFTRRDDFKNKWRKARTRKHNKSPNPSNAPSNIKIFTNKKVSNLKKQNENNTNGQVKVQTKSQSVITESVKDKKRFENLSGFLIMRTEGEIDLNKLNNHLL
jgi:hypothetical protein